LAPAGCEYLLGLITDNANDTEGAVRWLQSALKSTRVTRERIPLRNNNFKAEQVLLARDELEVRCNLTLKVCVPVISWTRVCQTRDKERAQKMFDLANQLRQQRGQETLALSCSTCRSRVFTPQQWDVHSSRVNTATAAVRMSGSVQADTSPVEFAHPNGASFLRCSGSINISLLPSENFVNPAKPYFGPNDLDQFAVRVHLKLAYLARCSFA